jgi:protein-L-isoaspartate(D-aspartate) O-methyltransferase
MATTMDYEKARFNMIEQQIRPWDVLDQDVLSLLALVKREAFVPPAYRSLAFADFEIPLPGGRERMLTPKLEARIVQDLQIRKHETVLEIGAGSGYMAALLGARAQHVTSVEIDPEIAEFARRNLADNGVANVEVVTGDAARGWPSLAPYDVIAVSGGLPVLPQELLEQLKVGGRLAAFVGGLPVMKGQIVTRVAEREYQVVDDFETYVAPLRNVIEPPRFRF